MLKTTRSEKEVQVSKSERFHKWFGRSLNAIIGINLGWLGLVHGSALIDTQYIISGPGSATSTAETVISKGTQEPFYSTSVYQVVANNGRDVLLTYKLFGTLDLDRHTYTVTKNGQDTDEKLTGKEFKEHNKSSDDPEAKFRIIAEVVKERTGKEVKLSMFKDIEEQTGASDGLMLTLQTWQAVTGEDLTKGRKIGGTGTIEKGGLVGPIGGARHKVVAASKIGIEVFLVPAGENYEEALEKANDLGTNIKVVPVETLEDALDYLRTN